MYRYDQYDQALVDERVAQFRDQIARWKAGDLTDDELRPFAEYKRKVDPEGRFNKGKLLRNQEHSGLFQPALGADLASNDAVRPQQRLVKRLRRAAGLRRAAQHADEVAAVVEARGRHRLHPAARHERRRVMLGQEADETAREDQQGDCFLLEAGGLARQPLGMRQRHVR